MNLLQLTQRLHRESGRAGDAPATLVDARKELLRLADKIGDEWRTLQQEPRDWKWKRRADAVLLAANITERHGADFGLVGFGRWRRPTREYTVRCAEVTNLLNVWPLTWRSYDVFVREFVDSPQDAGHPQFWTIGPSEELLVAPAGLVDHQLKLDWITDVTELAENGDEPDMPGRHHMLLMWRALIASSKGDASIEDVSRAKDQADAMLDSLLADQTDEIGWKASPLA